MNSLSTWFEVSASSPPTATLLSRTLKTSGTAVLLTVALLALLFSFTPPAFAQQGDGGQVSGTWFYPQCGGNPNPTCGTISISLSGAPSGISATANPTSVTGSQAFTVTATIGASTPPGVYSFNITTSCALFTCSGTFPFNFMVTPTGVQQIGKGVGAGCNRQGAPQCAEPIDIGTGNVFEKAVDYQTAGQNKLELVRYYNSRPSATAAGVVGGSYFYPLGNWRTNFDRDLFVLTSGLVVVIRPDGQMLQFTSAGGGAYTTDSDVDYSLTYAGGGYKLTCPDDSIELYQLDGYDSSQIIHLQQINYRNGYELAFYRTYFGPGDFTNVLGSVTDSYNRVITFTYNSNGTLTSITTPDSTIDYGFNASGLLTTVTYPTSPTSTITYNYGENSAPATALTSIKDENGNIFATWTYDANSRGLTNFMGGSSVSANPFTVAYNDSNGSRTVTNAVNSNPGVTDTYTFLTLQGVPKVSQISRAATTNTTAATETFGYDTRGFLNSFTDWNGNNTTYTNNANGMPNTIVEATNSSPVTRTTSITYDTSATPPLPHSPLTIATPGVTTSFTYDSSGDVLTKTLADTTPTNRQPYTTNGQTRTWTNTWSNFLLATVKTPNGNKTTLGYSSTGALTSITDALNHVTNITSHTGGGLPETIVDPNGITTTLAYDQRQRLTSSEISGSGGNFTTTYAYDAAGNLTKTTLPDNSYLADTYDTAHRVTRITNALGEYAAYTLDVLGDRKQANIYDSSNNLWKQHSATFDYLGRMLTDVGGMGQTTTYAYDTDGNALTVKDGNNNATTRVFDALNRLSTSTDANTPTHGVTTLAYDPHDRPLTVTDPNTNATAYVYDGFGDVIQQASPDSGTTVYHYDADANLTSKTNGAGIVTNYAYDALDRITGRTYPADSTQNVAYGYDNTNWNYGFGVGRLSWFTDAAGQMNFGYDERGNVVWTQRSSGSNTFITWGTYDAAGRPQGLTYPSGMYVGWTRDAAGNITYVGLVPPGSQTVQTVAWLAYDPFYGPLHYVTFGNNVRDGIWLDLDYRETASQVFGTSGNFTYQSYAYDNNNNLTGVSDTVHAYNNQTLGYDTLNRLTSATSGTGGYGSFTWTYDKVGNRLTQVGAATTTYGYTSGTNRLASITIGGVQTNISTNGNGNITSIPANLTTAATFTYNVANRLASVTGSQTAITNVYDGLGQRFSKQDPGSNPTYYTYDTRGNLLEESGPAGVTDYVYLGNTLLAVWVPSTSKLYYVQTDRLDTPQLVTDSNQNVVWSATYQPFGATSPVNSVTMNLRFPGQYSDLETSFNYNGFRDYMPNLGRYLEADPIGLAGGLNSFLYVSGNPGRFTDPTGLQSDSIGSAMNAAFSVATTAAATAGKVEGTDFEIAKQAKSIVNSKAWDIEANRPPYGSGTFKCNELVFDTANAVGANIPLVNGNWLYRHFGIGSLVYPPVGGQLGDPNFKLPGWTVVADPQPGDIVAEAYPNSSVASGHAGIVVMDSNGNLQTVSQSSITDSVVINDWGFRRGQVVVFRRYTGPGPQ